MSVVKTTDVGFTYPHDEEQHREKALDSVSLDVKKGQFISILGRNGSGKSTLAKMFNALLLPKEGVVTVYGYDTNDSEWTWEIRSHVGMVFQNPDNQIIGTTVEEDIAFGPENLGIESKEIRSRVSETLKKVGLEGFEKRAPHMLSGGQKQRTAIAGILASKPEIIVLDEATSMLDPKGRKEVLDIVHELNKNENITVINITHHMDETLSSDQIFVLDNGKVMCKGTASEIFSDVESIQKYGLEVPEITKLLYLLNKSGVSIPIDVMDIQEAALNIESVLK